MTSNLGSDRIQELMQDGIPDDKTYDKVKDVVLGVVVKHFSPEFVNRIDETVVFHPLAREQIRGIAAIQINLLNRRLGHSELSVEASDEVLDRIAALGYDPVYGARPLKRAIQNWIENPLAQQVIKGVYGPGDTITVAVDDNGEFVFGKRRNPD